MKKFNTLYVIGRYVCIAVFILFLFSCSHKVDIAKRLSVLYVKKLSPLGWLN